MHRYEIRIEKLRIVQTAGGAADAERIPGMREMITDSIGRFIAHDWGTVSESSGEMNDESLDTGDDILGIYPISEKKDIWICLDPATSPGAERIMTILYPDEY